MRLATFSANRSRNRVATAKQYPDVDPTLDPDLLPPIPEGLSGGRLGAARRSGQKRLRMSGEEFIRKWEANEFKDLDQSDIMFLLFMIPFTRDE